ncbi:MAG: hypothetical protein V4719_24125 [Planctomycetota bacterium]
MTEASIADYQFSALTEVDGEPAGALLTFEAASEQSNTYLKKVWEKLSSALRSHHDFTASAAECPSWVLWKPLEWSNQNIPARQKFVAWHAGILAGFVNIQENFPSQFYQRNILYLEHLAAFPGYLNCGIWNRKLHGLGIPLLAFAIFQSLSRGYSGIVGLHVDGPAMKFYDSLPDTLGFPVFQQVCYDVSGPHPHLDKTKTQAYLEVMPDAATRILEAIHV